MSNVIDMESAALELFLRRAPLRAAAQYVLDNGRSIRVETRSGMRFDLQDVPEPLARRVLAILSAIQAQFGEAIVGSVSAISYDDRTETQASVIFSRGFLRCMAEEEPPYAFDAELVVGDSIILAEFVAEAEPDVAA